MTSWSPSHAATHYNTLQHTAIDCKTLQHTMLLLSVVPATLCQLTSGPHEPLLGIHRVLNPSTGNLVGSVISGSPRNFTLVHGTNEATD